MSVTLRFNGALKPLVFGSNETTKRLSLACSNILYPTLFPGLSDKTKPVKIPTRKYSGDDKQFIGKWVRELLKDQVIEESYSPWRAQVVVVKKDPKWRLCIDYSQTVNRFTEEDAFPIPRIDDLINNLAQNKYFSKYDLKSAYHQVTLIESDKKY